MEWPYYTNSSGNSHGQEERNDNPPSTDGTSEPELEGGYLDGAAQQSPYLRVNFEVLLAVLSHAEASPGRLPEQQPPQAVAAVHVAAVEEERQARTTARAADRPWMYGLPFGNRVISEFQLPLLLLKCYGRATEPFPMKLRDGWWIFVTPREILVRIFGRGWWLFYEVLTRNMEILSVETLPPSSESTKELGDSITGTLTQNPPTQPENVHHDDFKDDYEEIFEEGYGDGYEAGYGDGLTDGFGYGLWDVN
ncbi:hypothetical protein GQ53DRAFT_774574 [Thozetella sp. PMI_491]|nr:hypothetical protein GQ53DRAFT_774574 [Thozetella sp. PMI_491]